ncbi:MAG: hypothetical protein HKL79_07480 [Thermoplasmata archaeon]|nr:hypothetical protein [Thermoplasmata archaeon]
MSDEEAGSTPTVSFAKTVLDAATEYKVGAVVHDYEKVRKSAEKMWLAVAQAADQYLAGQWQPVSEYIPQRLARLRVLGKGSLAGRVAAAGANLHALCFLNGECERVDLDLEEACELVQDLTGERGYCDSVRRILESE